MSDDHDNGQADEQRLQRRVRFTEEVKVSFENVDQFKVEYAENISMGGMFLATDTPLPVNTTLRFVINIADIHQKIAGKGLVVWTKEGGSTPGGRPSGMGLKFIELDDGSQAFIREFVGKYVNAEAEEE